MSRMLLSTDDSPPFILELIYRLRIRDVMTRTVISVPRGTRLREVQALMKENVITGIPVAEEGRLLGLISVDDILNALIDGYIDDVVENRMTRNLIVLEDDMPLSFAISYFEKYRYGRFPILDRNKRLVGIIASRDILIKLLLEFNREMEELETPYKVSEAELASGSTRCEFAVRKFDFENAGKASFEIKKVCKERISDPKTVRRIAVAAYELEMNLVIHSNGGKVFFSWADNKATIVAIDSGPGIPNVEDALREGFTTASEWVQALGFGAGMGLPNTKRVTDAFSIESSPMGTKVTAVIRVSPDEQTPREEEE